MGDCDIPSWLFFLIWIKIRNSDHTQHPLVPITGVIGPFISFLPSALCWGTLHLVALLAGWWQVSVRAGAVSRKGQLSIILHQWDDSSPGSGDSIYFFPSSVMGERHLLRWSPQRMNMVGYWGSQALPSNCRPFVELYFCVLNISIV